MRSFRIKKRYLILAGIIILLAAILFAAPRVACRYIVRHGKELAGRNIAIDRIRINYFNGTVRIYDLDLFEQDDKEIFLSFSRLDVNVDYLPLLSNRILVKHVLLDDPYVQVKQNGTKFNFSDLATSDSSEIKKDTIPSPPIKYIINDIRIARGYFKYTDIPLNHTIALNNLDLVIPGFTWNSDSTDLSVDFRFVDGGGLLSKLSINQADSTYSLDLNIDSLNLTIIEPYVKSSMKAASLQGFMSNDLRIEGSISSILKMFIRGVNHIYDFQLTDTLNRTVLSFKDLTADIDTLQPDRNRLILNYAGLTDPFILFEMVDTTNNWMAMMKHQGQEAEDTAKVASDTTAGSTPGVYRYKKLSVTGGKIQFADRTMRYPFEYSIGNLRIESSSLAGNDGKISLTVSALLNGTGTFNTDAVLDPSDLNDLDLKLKIGQFRMKDADAYFKHYFGFPVTGGIMNFSTENRLRPASLESNNTIYFRKFTLAESMKNDPEYKIPLRLALGVLSDKDGIIDLKAPVESKGKEVKIRNLGKIIFRVIGNLFVKAAVSPLNLLSGDYNIDPKDLQEIRLELLDPSPDSRNMKSVDIIADILNKKPGLNADIYYSIDSIKATDSLAYLIALNDFTKFAKTSGLKTGNVSDSTLLGFLLGKPAFQSYDGNRDLRSICRIYSGERRLYRSLDSLRSLQTGFISGYLSSDKQIAAERFRVIGTPPDTIKPSGDYPSFRVYFTIPGGN